VIAWAMPSYLRVSPQGTGVVVAILLLVACLVGPPPSDWTGCLVLIVTSLLLERNGLDVLKGYRFSPSAPLLIGASAFPGIGVIPAAVAVLLDATQRLNAGFLVNLSQRFSVAVALLTSGFLQKAVPEEDILILLGVCAIYLLARLFVEARFQPPSEEAERAVWRQLHIQIRPLETGLAALAPVVFLLMASSIWLPILMFPLLWVLHLAAENILLKSQEVTVSQTFQQLKSARRQERRAVRELHQTRQQKELLEKFAQFLSQRPSLSTTAESLVATTLQVLPVENVIVFLGHPPEPFSYEVTDIHQSRLQGSLLTGLTEPCVLRAAANGEPVFGVEKLGDEQRLLPGDRFVAAVPLDEHGVLYVGTASQDGFNKAQRARLLWLCEKAKMALGVAYKNHLQQQQAQAKELAVKNLQERVAELSTLVTGAKAMASSLSAEVLCQRFLEVVQTTLAQDAGCLYKRDGSRLAWGEPIEVSDSLRSAVMERRQAVRLKDPAEVVQACQNNRMRGLIAAPLLAGQEPLGVAVITTSNTADFSSDARDQFYLLCSQAAMALSNAGLYEEVVQARKELEESQARLVQSSKMTALGQLSAGVAHELNSPLGAISLCLDDALEMFDTNPKLAKKLLLRGQEGVERSKQIIERLMTYSRTPNQHLSKVCLRELVEDTLDFIRFQLKSAQVSTDFSGQGRFEVMAEYQALQQVITNLALNAAHAVEESENRLVSFRFQHRDGDVVLEIEDRGVGIAPENLQKIFDPFFTTKAPGKGTGLGLWASHQIVQQHHGRLQISSTLGKGTVFTLVLPGVEEAL
jgi:C4-dicarboxylate-specific signal transduction histidine kinase